MIRRVGVAIILVAVALLVTSSVGVSTVAVERPVSIEVVDDESATVGFDDPGSVAENATGPTVPAENASAVELTAVTNRAGTTLDVTVRGNGATTVDDLEAGSSIEPGETETVTASVTCEDSATASVDVVATGDGLTVERTVDVDCE